MLEDQSQELTCPCCGNSFTSYSGRAECYNCFTRWDEFSGGWEEESLKKIPLENLIQEDGSIPGLGNPYRESNRVTRTIFDFEDCVYPEIVSLIEDFLEKHPNTSWNSDVVKVYYSRLFSYNTKGNYSSIYFWRR